MHVRLLDAIAAQRLSPDAEFEVLVCDSGSTDGSAVLARLHGATVFEILRGEFSHGRTRNLLMRHARGSHVPAAAAIHSYDYSAWGWLQRSFDEARAMHEVYGWREPLHPRTVALNIWGRVGADWRWYAARHHDRGATARLQLLARSTLHHLARAVGSALGGRADRLPAGLTRRLSHERRSA